MKYFGKLLLSGNEDEYEVIIENLKKLNVSFEYYIHPQFNQMIVYFDKGEVNKLPKDESRSANYAHKTEHYIPNDKEMKSGHSIYGFGDSFVERFKSNSRI